MSKVFLDQKEYEMLRLIFDKCEKYCQSQNTCSNCIFRNIEKSCPIYNGLVEESSLYNLDDVSIDEMYLPSFINKCFKNQGIDTLGKIVDVAIKASITDEQIRIEKSKFSIKSKEDYEPFDEYVVYFFQDAYTYLKQMDMNTLGDLMNIFTFEDFMDYHFPKHIVKKIIEVMKVYNVSFNNEDMSTTQRKLDAAMSMPMKDYMIKFGKGCTPIEDIELSKEACASLKEVGIDTVEKLINISNFDDFVFDFPKITIMEIVKKMEISKIHFKDEDMDTTKKKLYLSLDMPLTDFQVMFNNGIFRIEDLHFSVRAYNCLRRAGIYSVDNLMHLHYEDLIRIRNLNKRNVEEIRKKLEEYGINSVDDKEE